MAHHAYAFRGGEGRFKGCLALNVAAGIRLACSDLLPRSVWGFLQFLFDSPHILIVNHRSAISVHSFDSISVRYTSRNYGPCSNHQRTCQWHKRPRRSRTYPPQPSTTAIRLSGRLLVQCFQLQSTIARSDQDFQKNCEAKTVLDNREYSTRRRAGESEIKSCHWTRRAGSDMLP